VCAVTRTCENARGVPSSCAGLSPSCRCFAQSHYWWRCQLQASCTVGTLGLDCRRQRPCTARPRVCRRKLSISLFAWDCRLVLPHCASVRSTVLARVHCWFLLPARNQHSRTVSTRYILPDREFGACELPSWLHGSQDKAHKRLRMRPMPQWNE
jgi:hypothetical protein